MKAAIWHGKRDVRVETVPDPTIQEPNDAIIRVTSSGICGCDLHLYEVLGPFLEKGVQAPLEDAPQAYADFQQKKDGTVKVLLKP
jgi:threonine dehydrogenase-like Zn-dependent dehydrogenase